jgi:hypothetical protein
MLFNLSLFLVRLCKWRGREGGRKYRKRWKEKKGGTTIMKEKKEEGKKE